MSEKPINAERALPEIIQRDVVAQSRLFRVEALQLRFSNGEERVYERIPGGNRHAVMIVPILNNDTLLLIREYAAGTHSYEIGFPKGLVDAGETDADAANRELQEEIGMASRQLTFLKQVSLAPGFMNARMAIFLAKDLYPQQLVGDEPEPLEVIPWPLQEADALLEHPQFHEARSVAALLLLLRHLKEDTALRSETSLIK
ncbi:ADP compounds hydrolase NudE [Tolumonas lignilytica]|jgi:NTP pyrophosphohydrolases including oxidative damage repair enzymes|uniref:ADP compounds hydrolase NudE n=1 Tax=Tolumonas lignilytica TaxID=1283284 RepID=UPI000464AC97|nr:ADP compounds hydrolase NudE [Tolumonas lignilytica]